MRKVIITGATSMIGNALVKYLLSKNIQVLAIIRKNSNRRAFLPKSNKLKVIECDLKDLKNLEIENDNEYDTIYHLAWDGTNGNERNDVYKQNLNVKFSLDVINFAKKMGCKRFIGAGSQAENGRVFGNLAPDSPTNPENGYGIRKIMCK